ncbi:MAG: hypothetical protein QF748_02235, partial [Candidatus Pacebacteria bacterium]|nr:hypothetical protein [Candidatus Paceibacterota bacterium]
DATVQGFNVVKAIDNFIIYPSLNITLDLNVTATDTGGAPVAVSGHINLSNNTNVTNNLIQIFVDGTEEILKHNFTDDSDTDFLLGVFINTNISGTGSEANLTLNRFNATGGTITTDGSYTIHTFTSSGTFNPGTASTSVEVLVVAGGGGGGEVTGGGGAGGGINYSASHAVSQQNYAVTVGAGGAGGDGAGYPAGATGSNSVFDSLTATGGGGGGGFNTACSGNGGGGSSGGPSNGCGTGGDGSGTPAHAAGGGGGDTGAGGDASGGDGNDGGAGGAGTAYSISGSSVTYSGGGGGGSRDDDGTPGSGGAGGGGAGSEDGNAATAGTVNTGGGGGGGSYRQSGNIEGKGGNGGSGIVIIRYVTATGVNSL